MTRPAKKAKKSKSNDKPTMPGPIIFKARGLNADVRLRAFDTEFRVHSVILKIHSAFFFKFLDSADKTAALADSTPVGGFKYEWVTNIDEDGSWSLVAKGNQDKNVQTENLEKFDGDKNKEVEALKKLLQAFYAELYELKSVDSLWRMTQLADYYCALPALSNTINLPFFRGDINVKISCFLLISISMKLHHADLFRECVIWIAGCWPDYANWDLSKLDPKIEKTIQNARNRIGAWIAEVHEELLYINKYGGQDFVSRLAGIKYSRKNLPQYFREINTLDWGDGESWERYDDIKIALEIVLENNLLYAGSEHEAGGERFPHYFFCATVDDNDLPWDRTQTDW